ncbi:neurogenic locus notch homolog protein 2-like isoform X3 [Crassostrea angulata]|uniref:neurogenic locus notch homolog protein 2-like isoform X3 n=1 Tax=Magallana angulata TaxID=2784310 RepID=UPI0022B10B05|nr:neurogenic locus notch homolog protein 2-like isoform X3 [Crassostrea angulata]
MRGLTLLPLLVAIVHCDTLYFRPRESPVSGVSCPDNKTVCPDGSTCCAGKTEEYLCCPLSSAVCCSDKIHCCPMGYECNVTTSQCQKGALIQSWIPSKDYKKKASLISGNVMCPDGQHECKDGQTCCKLASGQWGCCPIPKAVCCSDGKHCCPESTKCEVSQGKCMRGTGEMLDWFEKEPALLRSENVVCPDGQSECKSGQTCCKLASGNYGCCPIQKAVCCSDMKHCCPEGTTCDVSSGKCNRGNTYVMDWMDKQPAVVRAGSVMCPDGQHECKDRQTCCKLASGQWGCCPIPKAVCCSDGKHCCPESTKCEVSQGKCMRGTGEMLDWFEKEPALLRSENVVCPDGQSECKSGQTCCKLASGNYGCCPIPKAVCCSDMKHCCPEGTTCDVSSGKCNRGNTYVMDWMDKQPAVVRAGSVMCPDGQHECKDRQTCCKLASGQWGCCPIPKAVCCSDGKHCCPESTKCEVSQGKCMRGTGEMLDWFEKEPALVRSENVVCPDGQSQCKSGQTCCKLASGNYGCCPIPKAVCCSDMKHCCPEGTTCDVSSGKCKRGNTYVMDWMDKQPAVVRAGSVMCPDGQHECKDGQTCCKLASGQWGCCPIPKAVCCSDGKHCCPESTKCEVSQGKCMRGTGEMLDWFEKEPAVLRSENVVCPDGQSQCKSGQTCCKLASGNYGCCPIPKAVCCSDMKHCCPEGTTCDVSSGKCKRGSTYVMDWMDKQPAVVRAGSVMCPDGQHECKDGQTCCKLASGQWGCCPIPKAVCCSDGKHCCPEGTTCDVSSGKCNRGSTYVMDWMDKQPAVVRAGSVMCPDGQHECKDGQTCCKLASGQWGCCPIPKAVCCSDGKHCCPENTKCEVSQGKCMRGTGEMLDWLKKEPAVLRSKNVVCPDGQSECKSGQTCCKLASGNYGCCPIPKAVCCSDMKHCCPEGTTCDVSSGKCKRGNTYVMDWMDKQPAVVRTGSVMCPDGQHECKDGQTCCKLASGQWGCCPIPKAVCCSDGKHCCPENTKCEVSQGKCMRGTGEMLDWFEKEPALVRSENVVCPDGQSECKSGQTCCKLASGNYGCCPIPKAVCCSDMKHCCPEGTTCDVSSGKCKRGSTYVMDWMDKQPAVVRAGSVMCPDGQHECKDGQTCCKLASGQWGCCPIPKAVCCSDGKHCCPESTKCEVSQGKCIRADSLSMDWFEKLPALRTRNVVCPDGQSQCKDGQTCCKLATGQYGCCPIPKAVCCSDGKHCCPENTQCDVSSGKCKRGDELSMDWFAKLPALRSKNVVCPDGQSECKTSQTCCKLASGNYGCCPIPKAVCCSDMKHCCPENTKCDVSSGKCTRGDGLIVDWFEKMPLAVRSRGQGEASSVMCPDGASECEDGQTCCLLASGKYGCCPIQDAVCCSDHVHCCPQGTKCDIQEKKCIGKPAANLGVISMDMIQIQGKGQEKSHLELLLKLPTENVECPDGQSECKTGQTCCKTAAGNYGCCPLPKAVCCSDMKHCCPEGTTCDVSSGKCKRGNTYVMDWMDKQPAVVRAGSVMCPDGQHECKDGQTCCKLASGQWGCCPIPKAVCCNDGKHCCPENTKCEVSQGKCTRGTGLVLDWFEKLPALKRPGLVELIKKDNTIVCPDQKTSCPDKNTCCKNKEGKFGCCAYNNAVCCKSGTYCCPKGYICDTLPEICRMPEAKEAWKNTANRFIQNILRRKVQEQP